MKSKVLIIEPDTLLGKVYQDYLQAHGQSTVICAGAQEAITSVDHDKPDVIVLEVQLVSHNGYEFLYELRSYPEWHNIPIILHTLVRYDDLEANDVIMKQLGIRKYLYKPDTTLSSLKYAIDNCSAIVA